MLQEYKYISQDTLQYLSLHDCCCRHFYYRHRQLTFEMEWLEVLSEHPLNPYSQAHQSGKSRVEFVNPTIIECVLNENKTRDGQQIFRLIEDIAEIDFCDTEFITFEVKQESNLYYAKFFLLFDADTHYHSISLEIAFESALIMWNELNDISWFEDATWKKPQ